MRQATQKWIVVGIVLIGTLTGCSAVRAPGFSVVAVRETERTDRAVVLGFTIEAVNPNDVALPLRRASYTLTLDGERVFSGSRIARATVPRYGRQRFELPAVVPADRIDPTRFDRPGDMPYTLDGTVQYQRPGRLAEFLFDINLRRPKAPLHLRGTLDLPGEPGKNTPTDE